MMPTSLPVLEIARAPEAACDARWEGTFWETLPGVAFCELLTGAAPTQGTTLRLAYTEHVLKLLYVADDTDAWATMKERDQPLYEEEVVELFLDPVGDLQSYFEIEVNPLNTVLDLVIRRTRRGLVKNFAWQCAGLETAVVVGERAWCVEMQLPFAALTPDAPRPGTKWRGNFTRIDRPRGRPRELTAWAPTGVPTFHLAEHFGELHFV